MRLRCDLHLVSLKFVDFMMYKMFWNKIKSLLVSSYASKSLLCNRMNKMSSDPEKQIDRCRKVHSEEKISRFKNAFVLFYLFLSAISCWVIIDGLKSVGTFQILSSFPKPCPKRFITNFENIYDKGFSFDFNAFLSEKPESDLQSGSQPIWTLQNLTYYDGDERTFHFSINVSISEVRESQSLSRIDKKLKLNLASFLAHPKQRQSLPACLSQ